MKHTKEEILNALKVIKEECKGTLCEDCPFYSDETSRCAVSVMDLHAPTAWILNATEPKTWRAFK